MEKIAEEQELMEVHNDLSAIREKAPEIFKEIKGVVKGVRITAEALKDATRPPQATA